MSLRVCHLPRDEANAFVKALHRHHKPVVGHMFALAAIDQRAAKIVAVSIVGRPVSKHRDDGWTAEVTRLCSDGTRNACSFLYSASEKTVFSMGFLRIGTYTLQTESGSSLRALSRDGDGWYCLGERGGGTWSRDARPRVDTHPLQAKLGWECLAMGASSPVGGK